MMIPLQHVIIQYKYHRMNSYLVTKLNTTAVPMKYTTRVLISNMYLSSSTYHTLKISIQGLHNVVNKLNNAQLILNNTIETTIN